MGFLASMMRQTGVQAASASIFDDRLWSNGSRFSSESGIDVTYSDAMKTTAMYACVRLISESVAVLPLVLYKLAEDGKRERARAHQLFEVIGEQPNRYQTRAEFVQLLTTCALTRGNGYAIIVPDQRGPVGRLVPVDPDRMTVERVERGVLPGGVPDYYLRYVYTPRNGGRPLVINDEDVFHLRGLSMDGITGISIVEYFRDTLGGAIAMRQYGNKFFANNSQPGGVISIKGILSDDRKEELRQWWESSHKGAENAHTVAILEEGATWQSVAFSPQDSQFIQAIEFSVIDIARIFGVPPHMINDVSKSTTWGSGLEQMSRGFLTYTLMPWLSRWEGAVRRDLISRPQQFVVEFQTSMLLRADELSRANAHHLALQDRWKSRNEVRIEEGLNPIEGADLYENPNPPPPPPGQVPAEDPANQPADPAKQAPQPPTPPKQAPPVPPKQVPQPQRPNDRQPQRPPTGHYEQMLRSSAERILRKEQAALGREAKRSGSAREWKKAVFSFFDGHGPYLAEVLCLNEAMVAEYVLRRRTLLAEADHTLLDEHYSAAASKDALQELIELTTGAYSGMEERQ